jgi:hypothetical protein
VAGHKRTVVAAVPVKAPDATALPQDAPSALRCTSYGPTWRGRHVTAVIVRGLPRSTRASPEDTCAVPASTPDPMTGSEVLSEPFSTCPAKRRAKPSGPDAVRSYQPDVRPTVNQSSAVAPGPTV